VFDSVTNSDDLDEREYRALLIIAQTPWKRRAVDLQIAISLAALRVKFPGKEFLLDKVCDAIFFICWLFG